MTTHPLVNDLPLMFALFVTVALGYAISRWLERRSSVKPLKLKADDCKLAEEPAEEKERDAPVPVKDVSVTSKARAEARKRSKRNKNVGSAELVPAPAEVVPTDQVPNTEVESSSLAAKPPDACTASGADADIADMSTDTSPCWARVERIKAKKANRKARKAEEALRLQPEDMTIQECPALASSIEVSLASTTVAADEPTRPESTAIEEAKVTADMQCDRINDATPQLAEVSTREDGVNEIASMPCSAPDDAIAEPLQVNDGTTWGDVEDSDADLGDADAVAQQCAVDDNADSIHDCTEQGEASEHCDQDDFPNWEEDDTSSSRTWWKSKWSSWDDAPTQKDDWMKPFDDLIAVQAGQFQNDLLASNDNWNQGFDAICADSQQIGCGFEMMCPEPQQHFDAGMLPFQPFADCGGQQQLYTDGETVYMMMCVEMPETTVEQSMDCVSADPGMCPVGMPLTHIPARTPDEQVDAGMLTDEDL